MFRSRLVLAAIVLLVGRQSVAAAHADGIVSVTLRQLPPESLPAFVAALESALIPTKTPDGKASVRVHFDGTDRTLGLVQYRFAEGDELVRIDDEEIFAVTSAKSALRAKKPGDDLKFVLRRNGQTRVLAFEILPMAPPVAAGAPTSAGARQPAAVAPGAIAINAADLERELAQTDALSLVAAADLGMVRDNAGNVVGIQSPRFGDLPLGRMAGLQNGDVILGVNGMPINSEEAIFEIANKLQGQTQFAAQILRGGKRMTLRIHVR